MADDLLTPEEQKAAVEVFGEEVVKMSEIPDRDWLESHAMKAVDIADGGGEFIKIEARAHGRIASMDCLETLQEYYRNTLNEIASATVKAELLHREIVKRGGKV